MAHWLVPAPAHKLAGNGAHMMGTQAGTLVTQAGMLVIQAGMLATQAGMLVTQAGTLAILVGRLATEERVPGLVHAWTPARRQEVPTWATGWALAALAPEVPDGLL